MRRTRLTACLAAGMCLGLVACDGGRDDPDSPESSSTSSPSETNQPPVDLPDTPVGIAADWVLDQLAATSGPTDAEAIARFSAAFLDGSPPVQVRAVFDDLRRAGGWTPVDVDAVRGDAVVRLLGGSGLLWRMTVSVDDQGAITALLVRRWFEGPRKAARTWAEVHEQLTAEGLDVTMLAASVDDDGRCEPIVAIDPGRPMPLASIFKLYVLGAVAGEVDGGRLRWSDQLTVTDDVRSLPSGELQEAPNGTQVAVSDAAAGMIATSDNTAADLLATTVGDDAIAAALRELGHSEPQRNAPFLTTREFFTIGWATPNRREAWRRGDSTERHDILDELPAGPLTVSGGDVDDPAWASGVDWFGSAADVCAAHASLHDRVVAPGDADAPILRSILGQNRGVAIDERRWPYVAFKGGSAPGVVTGSWLGQRDDGERLFYSMQVADDEVVRDADRADLFDLAVEVMELLAMEPPG